jgi:hypothetical protein
MLWGRDSAHTLSSPRRGQGPPGDEGFGRQGNVVRPPGAQERANCPARSRGNAVKFATACPNEPGSTCRSGTSRSASVMPPARVSCPTCGVRVEKMPWSSGKNPLTIGLVQFLAVMARLLVWGCHCPAVPSLLGDYCHGCPQCSPIWPFIEQGLSLPRKGDHKGRPYGSCGVTPPVPWRPSSWRNPGLLLDSPGQRQSRSHEQQRQADQPPGSWFSNRLNLH